MGSGSGYTGDASGNPASRSCIDDARLASQMSLKVSSGSGLTRLASVAIGPSAHVSPLQHASCHESALYTQLIKGHMCQVTNVVLQTCVDNQV